MEAFDIVMVVALGVPIDRAAQVKMVSLFWYGLALWVRGEGR